MQRAICAENCLCVRRAASSASAPRFFRLVVLVFLSIAGIENSAAQTNPQYIVGYAARTFRTGSNLLNVPFVIGQSNGLNEIFDQPPKPNPPPLPEGTTISLWNPGTSSFDTTSTFTNGSWTTNLTLLPGTGALVVTPSPSTNAFAGIVLGHNGQSDLTTLLNPPPLFTGPNGIYLLGDKCGPFVDTGTNVFINILGRFPFVGEQVIKLSGTSTYLGNGQWDSVPTLAVGEAAFLNINSEPPPPLTIQYNNNQAIISWPFSPSDWTLQTNDNLTAHAWGNYAGSVANNSVTNSPLAGNLFFRLSYP